MADLLLLGTMFVVCGGLGLPVAQLLPARYPWRALTAPVFGFGVLGVLAPVTYQWGVSPRALLFGALAVALAMIVLHARRLARELAGIERRQRWLVGGGWLACLLVMALPRWIGGEQLIVFQGNPWDQFAYLESAMAYARRSHDAILASTDAQLARYPFLAIAHAQLGERPSTHLLFATFSRIAPDATYRLHYMFLIGCLSQFVLVAVFAVRSVIPKASPCAWIAIACVVPLGFWGQYALDINAWSQVASAPILLLLFVLLVHAAAGDTSLRLAGAAAVAIASALFLYPEGMLIYCAAAFPVVGLFGLVRVIRARRFELAALVPFTALAGLAAGALYAPILRFLWKQVTWSSGARVPWWQFFQAFFQGRDAQWGSGFDQQADFTAGLAGLYFATPRAEGALATLQRSALVFVVFALLTAVVVMVVRGTAAKRAWAIAACVMLLPAIHLYRAENYWPAGKVYAYAAPVLMLLLCMTIVRVRWLAIAFIAFQLAHGAIRISGARVSSGVHYLPPYPAVFFKPAKQDFRYDLRGLEAHLDPSMKVLVHPTYVWLEQRLVVFLYTRNIPYVVAAPGNTYFGDGRALPAPAIPWEPDVELRVEGRTFVLRFTSGKRPDIRVVARH